MLHPSYAELMNSINENAETDEEIVTSRYSIVIAAAKRARQLIENADSSVEDYHDKKPLSVAVEELMEGTVKILPQEDFEFEYSEAEKSIYDIPDSIGGAFSDEDDYDYSDDEEASERDEYDDEDQDDMDYEPDVSEE